MNGQTEDLRRGDVDALAGELRDLKDILREVSGKLGRIERRLRLFFPESFPKSERHKEKELELHEPTATINSQQALDLYSELVEIARTGKEQQLEARMASMGIADLALLVRELGAPLGKKPTRIALTKSLMGRLKQSIMLSRHTVRPSPERPSHQNETADGDGQSDQEESVGNAEEVDKPGEGH